MTKTFFLIVILLIFISILLQNTIATFVKLTSGRPQCFIEDLNENAQALVHYKFPCRKENPQNKLKIEISDPFSNLLLQQDLENWDGVVPFKSLTEVGGIYEICFQAYLPQLSETNLYVDIEVDDDAKHYDKLESKDRLKQLEGLLDKIRDKLDNIYNDQLYFKTREERFRITSETILNRAFWFGLLQVTTLIVCGIWQVSHLKYFFKQKKLA
jgi:hypothetical protein